MKKRSLFLKLLAAALCACILVAVLAGCGSARTLMSLTIDGKT